MFKTFQNLNLQISRLIIQLPKFWGKWLLTYLANVAVVEVHLFYYARLPAVNQGCEHHTQTRTALILYLNWQQARVNPE